MPVLRTNGPYYQATGRALLLSSVAIAAITITLPCSPLAGPLRLITVPAWMVAAFVALSVAGPSACPPVATSGRRLPRRSDRGLPDPPLDRPRHPVLRVHRRIADAATSGTTVRLAHVLIQPIAAEDVASALADGIVEIAGPQQFRLD